MGEQETQTKAKYVPKGYIKGLSKEMEQSMLQRLAQIQVGNAPLPQRAVDGLAVLTDVLEALGYGTLVEMYRGIDY